MIHILSLHHAAYSSSMVPGGFEVLQNSCQLEARDFRDGALVYVQVIDNTRHTIYLIANSARNILK